MNAVRWELMWAFWHVKSLALQGHFVSRNLEICEECIFHRPLPIQKVEDGREPGVAVQRRSFSRPHDSFSEIRNMYFMLLWSTRYCLEILFGYSHGSRPIPTQRGILLQSGLANSRLPPDLTDVPDLPFRPTDRLVFWRPHS